MEPNPEQRRQQAHLILDMLPDEKIPHAAGLLEEMLDPVTAALAKASPDDEAVSEAEAREITAAREALAQGRGIAHEDVLREFGLSPDGFEQMGQSQ